MGPARILQSADSAETLPILGSFPQVPDQGPHGTGYLTG